jgi:putative membrane protein
MSHTFFDEISKGIIMHRKRYLVGLLLLVLLLLALTAIKPYDRGTWLMEVAPVIIAIPVLILTYRRLPLTTLLYTLIFLHAIVLIVGGVYTYARVPLGFWMQEIFSLSRNHYDRIGHFCQGFVPTLIAREILLKNDHVKNGRMLVFLCICVAMAISAWYELIEWAAALGLGQAADEFLGTQGDPWDTQWDMFMCFVGSVTAILTLSRLQDRQMKSMDSADL